MARVIGLGAPAKARQPRREPSSQPGWPVTEKIQPGFAEGAIVVSDRRPEFGWVILADPEGNEFCVEISAAELEAAQVAKAAT
jgi:hypothetical protein